MPHDSTKHHASGSIGAVALWLGLACLLPTCGCSRPAGPAAPQPDASEQSADTSLSPELEALADRLRQITDEVAASPERRVHGVRVAAHYRADHETPRSVLGVVLNVNVDWCDDGCIDGPGNTPAHDDDLVLLLPFAETLQKLDVQHTEITNGGLSTIAQLTELESLNLAGTRITGGGLARLATLNKLQTLDLRGTTLAPADLGPLGELTSLRTIQLPETAITDDVLAALGHLPHLRSLVLAKAQITDRGLASLAELKQVESLDVSQTGVTDAGLVHLAHFTNLTQLRLPHTNITGAGLSQLRRLTHLQELDLAETAVDDAGLVHLSDLRDLASLDLSGTRVRGHGLVHLKECRNLHEVALPPVSLSAIAAVNALKSWKRLSLTLVSDADLRPTDAAAISDMPVLSHLAITCESPLKQLHVANCPQLASVAVLHRAQQRSAEQPNAEQLAATSLQFDDLPALRDLYLEGSFDDLAGDEVLRNVARIEIDGSLTSNTVRGINRCRGLKNLNMHVASIAGEPLPNSELDDFRQALGVTLRSDTAAAAWLTRLIANMPTLETLDLSLLGLTAANLAGLENCTQLKHFSVRGIDDPGEPLAFLNSMPHLDQCLVLGCPRVGRIRLTQHAGVQRLYFKYGRLDELDIDGAPNLTAVYLGHEAHGFNDDDARLNKLDIGTLAARNVPNLLYLMVDGLDSTIPFTEIFLADAPKLRSLLLRAPPEERQLETCRLAIEGTYPMLVQRRLFHFATDQSSLDRLNNSPILRGGDVEDVDVSSLDDPEELPGKTFSCPASDAPG